MIVGVGIIDVGDPQPSVGRGGRGDERHGASLREPPRWIPRVIVAGVPVSLVLVGAAGAVSVGLAVTALVLCAFGLSYLIGLWMVETSTPSYRSLIFVSLAASVTLTSFVVGLTLLVGGRWAVTHREPSTPSSSVAAVSGVATTPAPLTAGGIGTPSSAVTKP